MKAVEANLLALLKRSPQFIIPICQRTYSWMEKECAQLWGDVKAETNFADVVPQAKRLLVSLNIDIHDIHDPRGLCRDVADLGRWGNGNTEAALASLDDVPYVVGLARQALERQLSDTEVTE